MEVGARGGWKDYSKLRDVPYFSSGHFFVGQHIYLHKLIHYTKLNCAALYQHCVKTAACMQLGSASTFFHRWPSHHSVLFAYVNQLWEAGQICICNENTLTTHNECSDHIPQQREKFIIPFSLQRVGDKLQVKFTLSQGWRPRGEYRYLRIFL